MNLEELNELLEKDAILSLGKGFIRLPRGIITGLFSEDPDKRRRHKIYLALIVLANHSDGITEYKGIKIHLRKGELFCTLRDLTRRTDNQHHKPVKRFLKILEKQKMIEVEESEGGYLIRVLHYEEITGSYLTQKGVRQHNRKAAAPTIHPLDQLSPTGSGRTLRQEQEELQEKMRRYKHKFE